MAEALARAATRAMAWLEGRRRLDLVLVVVAVAMIALTFDPRVSRGGDNALYYALARSLAETGTYRNLVAPGEPYETSVPWGYPLLLAGGMRVFDAGYVALTLVSAVAMLVAVIAVFHALEPHGRGIAFLVGIVVCFDDFVIDYASKLLTEAPYMATSFGALALAQRVERRWSMFLAAPLVAASYLIRPIGITLIAALFTWLWIHRRWRDLVIATPLVAAIAGWWHVRCLLVPSAEENLYVRYFLQESKYQTSGLTVDALGLLVRFFHNASVYALDLVPKIAVGEEGFWPAGALLSLLVAVGFATTIRRWELAHFYLPLQLATLFLWLPESADVRYLVVVFPLLVWFAFLGAGEIAARLRPDLRALAIFGLFACLAGAFVERASWVLPRAHEIQRGMLAGDPLAMKPVAERSFVDLCEWLEAHTDPRDVVASRKARLVWYYADRKAVDLPATDAPDEVVAFLDRQDVDYVVIDSLPTTNGRTRKRFEATLAARPDRFVSLFSTASGDSVVRFLR